MEIKFGKFLTSAFICVFFEGGRHPNSALKKAASTSCNDQDRLRSAERT
jgi:hypothetical protein